MTTTRGRGRARAANATTTTTTRHRRRHRAVRARASEDANEASERTTTTTTTTTKVVVLGGTGRVGSATAAALVRGANGGVEVTLGGRSRERDAEAKARHRGLANASFVEVDVCDKASVTRAIQGADLVINTAGPFQRRKSCAALEAALESGVKYLDVCDDASYGAEAKKLSEKAKAAGVAAITCAGIYPGVSNLMARDIVESMKAEFRATEELSLIHISEPTRPY